jgi:hypothetical protein
MQSARSDPAAIGWLFEVETYRRFTNLRQDMTDTSGSASAPESQPPTGETAVHHKLAALCDDLFSKRPLSSQEIRAIATELLDDVNTDSDESP